MKFFTTIPYVALIPLAVLMALGPFGTTPHLIEKGRMLFAGTLQRPLDCVHELRDCFLAVL
jgi:hypothetical protein